MIYPQKLSSKKSEIVINILLGCSLFLGIIMILINKFLNPNIPWAAITNAGIVYTWITVIYSIKRNTNIASHVLLQMIAISILVYFIDYRLGFSGWSSYIAIPIILIIANITMLVLSIVSHKKYARYAIYQLIIVLLSLLPLILATKGTMKFEILNLCALIISLVNFSISLVLSYKEFYNALKCNFHM